MSNFDSYYVPPDIEVEQNVLGSVMRDPEQMDRIMNMVADSDFTHPNHALLWSILKRMHLANRPIDEYRLIEQEFRRDNASERFGIEDMDYIRRLAENVLHPWKGVNYAEQLRLNAAYYKLERHAALIAQTIKERPAETADDLYRLIRMDAEEVEGGERSGLRTLEDAEAEFMAALTAAEDTIPTGFAAYDEWAKGYGRGWLVVLAGRAGAGKTAKSIQTAFNIARRRQGTVLFWSQEMKLVELMFRVCSSITGIPYSTIRNKEMTPEQHDIVATEYRKLKQLPIRIDDSPSVSMNQVRAAATKYRRKFGKIDLIVVDYLTRMDIKVDKNQTNAKAVGDVAKRFKWLARELDCPVMLLAQINREGVEGKPGAHHLKDSGDIEQEADLIEILWNDKDGPQSIDQMTVNASIVKGRFTGVRDMKYTFMNTIQRFADFKYTQSSDHIVDPQTGYVKHVSNRGDRRK